WGLLDLVWQSAHGSSLIWGIACPGSVRAWIPLMVFAFLFGLSMDYEVFILARMREEFDRTGSTDTAVVRGIGRTGRLVTSAALILFLAFVSLASGPDTNVKMFATGLGAGILFDATVIRALLVPAAVSPWPDSRRPGSSPFSPGRLDLAACRPCRSRRSALSTNKQGLHRSAARPSGRSTIHPSPATDCRRNLSMGTQQRHATGSQESCPRRGEAFPIERGP